MSRWQFGLAGNCQASSVAGPLQGKADLVREDRLSWSRQFASCAPFPYPPTTRLQNKPYFLAYFAKNGQPLQNNQRNHWLFRLKCQFEGDTGQITSVFTGYCRRVGRYGGNRSFYMGYFGCRAINQATQGETRQDLLLAAAREYARSRSSEAEGLLWRS